MVQQHPMKVSTLDSVFKNLVSFKFPTSVPASTPAPRVVPKPLTPPQRVAPKPPPTPPVPKPAVPSWMKKTGYRQPSDD
jgi:hypothetical protein